MSSESNSKPAQTARPISISQVITGHELRLRQIEQYMKLQEENSNNSEKSLNNSSVSENSNQQRLFQEMNRQQHIALQEIKQKQHNLTTKMDVIVRNQSGFSTQLNSYKEHINKLNELYVLFHREFLSFKEFIEETKKVEMIITEKTDTDADEDTDEDADADADEN